MGGMGGGGGDDGHRSRAARRALGAEEAARFHQPVRPAVLGMKPKPPPKYRMLIMMATNMPRRRSTRRCCARAASTASIGRLPDRRRVVSAPTRATSPRSSTSSRTSRSTGSRYMTPYATGRDDQGPRERGADQRDPGRPRHHHLDRRPRSEAPEEPRAFTATQELHRRDRHGVAVHEACHAVVAYRARKHLEIDIATIEPGNDYLGTRRVRADRGPLQACSSRSTRPTSWCRLASLAGERHLLRRRQRRPGVSGDLEQATELAILMEGFWGMGSTIASHAITTAAQVHGGASPEATGDRPATCSAAAWVSASRTTSTVLLRRTAQMLERDRDTVLCVAHALEVHKTLSGEDVVAVIERTPGPIDRRRPLPRPGVRRRDQRLPRRDARSAPSGGEEGRARSAAAEAGARRPLRSVTATKGRPLPLFVGPDGEARHRRRATTCCSRGRRRNGAGADEQSAERDEPR